MRAWSLRTSLAVLGAATVVTALIAEILVGAIDEFADSAGLSDFFVAAVIVAIVGNAAEHGGAVVVAYRGRIKLAAEIALASSAQVAVFLIPAVALLSWLLDPLALSFRPVELGVARRPPSSLTVAALDAGPVEPRARGRARGRLRRRRRPRSSSPATGNGGVNRLDVGVSFGTVPP